MTAAEPTHTTALLLPGGGARAAYQVGALKALAQLTGEPAHTPFPIVCGTSAGAINAVALASRAGDFSHAVRWLETLWLKLSPQQVYRSDLFGLVRNALRLGLSLFNAGSPVGQPVALLDNTPLRTLLAEEIDFGRIGDHIRAGALHAVCVTAMNYNQGTSISFFQGGPDHAGWQRWRRQGIPTPLQLRHLMASTAIPTLFPPEQIGQYFYGDGALRQLTPISPALHLGARRVLIIPPNGHRREYHKPIRKIQSPAFGQVIGNLLNSAFIDSLETDIELLERINELLALLTPEQRRQLTRPLQPVESLVISPSQDLDTIAELHLRELPYGLRNFLRATGSGYYSGGVNLASYLAFTQPYIQQLIELGYSDVIAQADAVRAFLRPALAAAGERTPAQAAAKSQ